jgi:hypothetical protein
MITTLVIGKCARTRDGSASPTVSAHNERAGGGLTPSVCQMFGKYPRATLDDGGTLTS